MTLIMTFDIKYVIDFISEMDSGGQHYMEKW